MVGFTLALLYRFLPFVVVHVGGVLAGIAIVWFGVSLWSFAAESAA